MSVLIKGMEMPTRCENCVIFDPETDECALIGKTPWSWEDETGISTIHRRPDNCPLVPVPPHGRLIDADAMIRNIEKAITPSRYIKERNADMVKFLSLEDTIIPAEEDE